MTLSLPLENRGLLLLVDDEADILTALSDLFEEEFDLLTSTSPVEALALLAAHPQVAVIVSDQRMPGMTGDVFLGEARRISEAEAILLTGYADLKAVTGAVNSSQIVGFVPKPWDPASLLSTVRGAYRRRQLARELQRERAMLLGLLEHSTDAIAFKDADRRFLRLNAAKAAMLGVAVEDAIGRREEDFAQPQFDPLAEALALAEQDASEAVEERNAPDGAARWLRVARVPIRPGEDAPAVPGGALAPAAYLATIERDVTDQRHLEERLRQADKMQALGTLAGGVAHDFNNLLTAILGSLDLASRRLPDDPKLKRLLGNASLAAQRGAALTQRLLSFSRRSEIRAQVIDPNEVIEGMEDLLERTLGGLAMVHRDFASAIGPIEIDPGQLELAVLNLCINARDAMPAGGTVTVSTRNVTVGAENALDLAEGQYTVVSVSDTGTGIPAALLARVFEPFFTTKDVGRGTGLGLSMVYGLAQQAGGAVQLRSVEGEGTTVALYFPQVDAAARSLAAQDLQEPAEIIPARIVLVDDDTAVREVTAAYLLELGHGLREASEGMGALKLLAEQEPDVLVADFAMPGMSGLELALEARHRHPDLPILLMTGHADAATIPAEFSVLYKPFQRSALAAKVAELTARRLDRPAAQSLAG